MRAKTLNEVQHPASVLLDVITLEDRENEVVIAPDKPVFVEPLQVSSILSESTFRGALDFVFHLSFGKDGNPFLFRLEIFKSYKVVRP